MDSVIEVFDLVKIYRGGIKAIDHVTIEVKRGEIFALLGVNGAGKTTLMKILLSLVKPTSGRVYILGEPVEKGGWKGKVGYLPEMFRGPNDWKVEEIIEFLGRLGGLEGVNLKKAVNKVIELVGLYEVRKRKIKTLSKGMILRLGLAQAIVHNPEILLLDEPTEGLDPIGRKEIRKLLMDLRDKGVTIFLNSHLLSEVEILADHIAILHKGKLVISGSVSDIMPREEKYKVELFIPDEKDENFKLLLNEFNFSQDGREFIVIVKGVEELNKILAVARDYNIEIRTVAPLRSNLEDIFISYIRDVQ